MNAIDLVKRERPDVMLMDIRMPEMDGLEATRRLRAMPAFARTPIVALTASTGKEAEAAQLEAGCTAHLAKPVRPQEVIDAVARFLPPGPSADAPAL